MQDVQNKQIQLLTGSNTKYETYEYPSTIYYYCIPSTIIRDIFKGPSIYNNKYLAVNLKATQFYY